MPIIKSAKKKLRQDIKRTKQNKRYELTYKKAIDAVKKRQKTKAGGLIYACVCERSDRH